MNNPIEIVKSFYEALGRGDVSSVLATLHNDLEWTEAERFPYYSGTWRSPQEVRDKLLVPLSRDWEGFAATPNDFIVDGERASDLPYSASTQRFAPPVLHSQDCVPLTTEPDRDYIRESVVRRDLALPFEIATGWQPGCLDG